MIDSCSCTLFVPTLELITIKYVILASAIMILTSFPDVLVTINLYMKNEIFAKLYCFIKIIGSDTFWIQKLPARERSLIPSPILDRTFPNSYNKNLIMRTLKSSRDIQKKEDGPDRCFG